MMMKNAIHGNSCVYALNFHIVFTTKYRRAVFTTEELREEMKQIFIEIAKTGDFIITKQEVMDDHVHMLVSFHPKYSPAEIVKKIKGASARRFSTLHPDIKEKCNLKSSLWSAGYYIGSLGDMSKKTVENYIANQYN